MNSATDRPLLALKNIVKTFPGVRALSQASLNVYSGKVMALLGENGAGKSTLMKVLTGIYQRDSGTIDFLGQPVNFASPKASAQAGIGIIHQELNLIPQLTVAENIFLGREPVNRYGKIRWHHLFHQADALLARLQVNFSSKMLVAELSIGQQQMVEIAKVLSFSAQVIIMDEPTDALADHETAALFAVIEQLKQQGCGIVYISHRLQEIFRICDDVTVFRDGQFIAQQAVADINQEQLIEMMVGRKLTEQYPRINLPIGQPRLTVTDLVAPKVQQVSFSLHAGEILGIAGLMGAGRSELAKALYGAIPAQSGQIYLDGQLISNRSPAEGLEHGIVYISEDRKRDGLVLGLSVKENMSLPELRYLSGHWGQIKQREERQAVDDFIAAFHIRTPSREQNIGLLSGGNQQKVAIARGLMTRPKVLILDEPTRGVDVGAKKEIYQLINQFKQQGLSIILISSEMPEIVGMSDTVLVLHEGRVASIMPIEQANQENIMAAAVGNISTLN